MPKPAWVSLMDIGVPLRDLGPVETAGIKKLVDVATLPDDAEFAAGLQAYFATAGRPERRPFVELLFKNGMQQPDGIEIDLGTTIGKLRQNP